MDVKQPTGAQTHRPEPDVEPLKVLIVDDEADIRLICSEVLNEHYLVKSVADGSEVPPMLTSFRPDIIVSDLKMPREGGLSVLRKAKQECPLIEVLLITGYGRIEDAIEAIQLGASDFLLKPFDINQLQTAVGRCAGRIRLRRQNQDLQQANRELTRLNDLKEKFLRLTSHELRGPLTVLQGYCDLLPLLADSPAEVTSATEAMSLAVNSLGSIVENLTTLLSTYQETLLIVGQPLRIQKIVEQAVEEVRAYAAHRGHTITIEDTDMLSPVIGDRLRLRQILRELLLNSVKFTPDGGWIRVKIHRLAEPGWFALVVEDSGIGIEPSALSRIFEAFYEQQNSIHHSTSRTNFRGGGIGVGLTLVREIVTTYGGRVGITSEPGKGTEVVVSLPSLLQTSSASAILR
ncbi:MAG: response regulator [Acidobacteria bacterium]|nr:response regulator [Acidobacteriota bacterium]